MKDELMVNVLAVLDGLEAELGRVRVSELCSAAVLQRWLGLVGEAELALVGLLGLPGDLDVSGQVFYFKRVYPRLKGLALYAQGRFLRSGELEGASVKELRRFYQGEVSRIDRFFMRYQFHYGYFCLGGSELDGLFFSLGAGLQSVLLPVLALDVPAGVPLTGYLFALFVAKERLRVDLLGLLAGLDGKPVLSDSASVSDQGALHRPFQWTAEVVNLIELAHALHLKGAVNDGQTGIVEFFEGLGDFFGVNLGVPKRGFEDLKARKRLSKTHFTDSLRDALLEKMAESDAWLGAGFKR